MSFTEITSLSSQINIDEKDAVGLNLVSDAFKELMFAHIITEEAEKIEFILGTMKNCMNKNPTVDDLIRCDQSVEEALKNVIKKDILLQFTQENMIRMISTSGQSNSTIPNSHQQFIENLPTPEEPLSDDCNEDLPY